MQAFKFLPDSATRPTIPRFLKSCHLLASRSTVNPLFKIPFWNYCKELYSPSMAVRISLIFSASAEQLFKAWTDSDLVEQWLFKNETSTVKANIDARSGGKFRIVEQDGGLKIDHFGTYVDVIKAKRLTFTLEVPAHFEGQSRVSVEFKQTDAATEMNFVQVGVDPEIVQSDWNRMFQNLTRLLLAE